MRRGEHQERCSWAQLRGEEVGKEAAGRNGGTEDKGEGLWRQWEDCQGCQESEATGTGTGAAVGSSTPGGQAGECG